MRLSTLLIYALLVSGVAMVLLFIAGIYSGFAPIMELAFASAFLLIGAQGVAVGCAIALERQVAPRLMISGLIATVIGLGAYLVSLWFDAYVDSGWVQRVAIWPSVWACVAALLGLLHMARSPGRWWSALRRITIALLCIFAAHIVLTVTFAPTSSSGFVTVRQYEELAARTGIGLGVLFLGAFATTFLTLWMVPKPEVTQREPLWLTCPRCDREQTLETGGARCGNCGLGIKVSTL